ncbi:MAG: triose-phosphate isomerase [Candidatus Binatia bacterium]
MPTPLLAGNWKLNGLSEDTAKLASAVAEGCQDIEGREVMIATPYTTLHVARSVLDGSPVALGAQDLYWEETGAFTGEVSAPMLVDAGCRYVIIGHSERREFFGETDYSVAKKVAAAYRGRLTPVVCVGESLAQREQGMTAEVIERQVRAGLCELEREGFDTLVIAYEPIWAIGTGETATAEQAEEVHRGIRAIVADMADDSATAGVRILYGGSVKPDNIDELMSCPNIDGALVGGASLDADSFLRIVHYEE